MVKFSNSCWNFKLDEVNFYAYQLNVFSKEECSKIIKTGKNKGLIDGTVFGEEFNLTRKNKKEIRDSKITWLYPNDDMDWVFRRCTDVITDLNNRFFKFDLYGFNEGFQFTNYKSPGGKYVRHIDRRAGCVVRKLSFSIQLTDPLKYKGGDLCLYDSEKKTIMEKSQGAIIVFPSYVVHGVEPVTKGERNSLVSWVTGPSFK